MPRQPHTCTCTLCQAVHARRRNADREDFVEARLDGYCGRCRKRKATQGFRTCSDCRTHQAAYKSARKQRF